MPTRRVFLEAALAAGLIAPTWSLARAKDDRWSQWTRSYVSNGRVIDPQQGHISHSEGQGYGLLLAQAVGDRVLFEQIETWSQHHLAIRRDSLMVWKWVPGYGRNVADWHNATDGDLFRAWALLRAERDSGWIGYQEKAIAIAHDVADLCLATDPRATDEWLLIPGAEAPQSAERVLFNPSYIMPRALRELGAAADEPMLIRAADHGETVLAELAAAGLLPDWVDITPSGFEKPSEHDRKWGYDALRVPLYLAWSGHSDHPAVDRALKFLEHGSLPDHLVVEATADGQILAQSNKAGFRALHALARCKDIPDQLPDGTDYYADTLLLLAQVAQREASCTR
ncbi:MAG: glycosyl hydrolase family 5 [Alphaproteobacteria bacterium]|nr:glycosyl hydrolase family 5 [Alphaproteobacteria bacterium]